jgi:hypothetical protein
MVFRIIVQFQSYVQFIFILIHFFVPFLQIGLQEKNIEIDIILMYESVVRQVLNPLFFPTLFFGINQRIIPVT